MGCSVTGSEFSQNTWFCGACFDSTNKENLTKGDEGVGWCNGPIAKDIKEENIFTGRVIATDLARFMWADEDKNGWQSDFFFEKNADVSP